MGTQSPLGGKMNDEFRRRLDESIRMLCEKRLELTEIDKASAEVLLIEAECVVACLYGFLFCAAFESRMAGEMRNAGQA